MNHPSIQSKIKSLLAFKKNHVHNIRTINILNTPKIMTKFHREIPIIIHMEGVEVTLKDSIISSNKETITLAAFIKTIKVTRKKNMGIMKVIILRAIMVKLIREETNLEIVGMDMVVKITINIITKSIGTMRKNNSSKLIITTQDKTISNSIHKVQSLMQKRKSTHIILTTITIKSILMIK